MSSKPLCLDALAMAAVLCWSAAVNAQTRTCPMAGYLAPDALATEWILVGWEKEAGDGPLDFRAKLGRFYDWEQGSVAKSYYDDLAPGRRVASEPGQYGAAWEGPFTALKSAHHRISLPPSTLSSGTFAHTSLQFVARLTGSDDKLTGIRTQVSLVWRCTQGGWRIVREHNSSTVLDRPELDAAWAVAAGR